MYPRSGFEPGMRSRRHQGGGGCRRGFQHPDQGGGEAQMYLRSGFEPGILCGDIREEEDVAAFYRPSGRRREGLISCFGALSALCIRWPLAARRA